MKSEPHPFPARPTKTIHVKGTDREIGRQHAEQVGEDANRGMVHFYYSFWRRMLGLEPKHWLQARLLRTAKLLVDPWLVGRLTRQIPATFMDRLQGVSEITGRPLAEFSTAMILPDLLPLLEGYSTKLRPKSFIEVIPPPRFGCSSFVAKGDSFLYGRNLDFPGIAYWDRYPVFQVTTPTKGLRHIGFTTAGAPLSGISGVNEAQISVALHQHYCRNSSLRGTLPFIIGERILNEARSLDDAVSILRDSRVATSWAFIVTDGKTKNGFIYETQPNNAGIRWLNDNNQQLTHSNYYQTLECQPAEFAATCRMNWDNYYRKSRLEELVRAEGGKLNPARAVQYISDHFDPYWGEEKAFNRTVSQAYNIQSYVLDPSAMKIYFAEGDAPVHLGKFREYDLGQMFGGKSGVTDNQYPAYAFKDPKKRECKQEYILSFIAAFDGDYALSLVHLRKCLAADFTAEAAYIAAVVMLKLGELEEGRALLERAAAFIVDKMKRLGRTKLPPEYFEIVLFLGRANDLLGKRTQALECYSEVGSHRDLDDANLRHLARNAGVYQRARLDTILTPFSAYIPFE